MGKEYTRSFGTIGQVSPYGPIILFDDLEPTLFKWLKFSGPAGSAISRDVAEAKDGLASLKFDTGAAPAINDTTTIGRRLYARPSGIYTLEAEFRITTGNRLNEITFRIGDLRTGGSREAAVSYDDAANDVKLQDTSGTLVVFPNNAMNLAALNYHRIQFSININTGKYLNLQIDSKVFDVSAVSYQQFAGSADGLTLSIVFKSSAAAQEIVNIDNIMLREGQPDI